MFKAAISNKQTKKPFFSFTKSENRRAGRSYLGDLVLVGGGGGGEMVWEGEYCANTVYKWKNETC
jgi:hypothetical protein